MKNSFRIKKTVLESNESLEAIKYSNQRHWRPNNPRKKKAYESDIYKTISSERKVKKTYSSPS